MNNYYMVNYIRRSGGIKENITEYYCSEHIVNVVISVMTEFNVNMNNSTEMHNKIVDYIDYDYLNLIPQRFSIEGEFFDNIMNGGDWIYYDIFITPIKKENIEYPIKITEGKLKEFTNIKSLKKYLLSIRTTPIFSAMNLWKILKDDILKEIEE